MSSLTVECDVRGKRVRAPAAAKLQCRRTKKQDPDMYTKDAVLLSHLSSVYQKSKLDQSQLSSAQTLVE